jgi:anti-anti-sigma factor
MICIPGKGGAMPASVTTRRYRPDPADTHVTHQHERRGRAVFSARQTSPSLMHLTAVGEIDAVNGRALASYVERHTGMTKQIILDLRGVDFFGSQGFTALCYIRAHCTAADVDWLLVGSRQVHRILSICDPDGQLPLANRAPEEPVRQPMALR